MRVAWTRAIRFVAPDGRVLRGEPILPASDVDIGKLTEADALQAKVIVGDDLYDESGATYVSEEVVAVKKLLGPLAQSNVPILRCIGLNYLRHILEVPGREPPPFPSIFFKSNTTVNDHDAAVIIPKICQDDQADYEGELCTVMGRDAKDVSIDTALEYVAGFTCGNDLSSRKHQRDPAYAGDPEKLHLRTIVDGEVRQNTALNDLLFSCAYIVSYLSSGTTLQKGSVIMTGTPGGVGASFNPPKYLKPDTVMEVEISKIGTLRNYVEFA
ncbi:uncharacterized protein A1O5_12961 [Cladophialophora psammophila CBS 110553]|uniref:Fumarylacetoacetase-like C-terminal domain-containing protein n=1 Tax=Cladophialophora psammophila CBS 110553 TaxID=1182543 RepID=W9VPG9_9EURO|nr:uncharacterized protein A1O5_12961 [Cladophialophora psammophila CBS 110553]EXJ54895.1 hypothetical protein A1O5_12961 [Cladophialophora psammophila CBS 110553]